MTQCTRCGLISSSDVLCSWCGQPLLKDAPLPAGQTRTVPGRSRWAMAALGLLILLGFLLMVAPSRTARVAAISQGEDQTQAITTRSTLRASSLPGIPTPKPDASSNQGAGSQFATTFDNAAQQAAPGFDPGPETPVADPATVILPDLAPQGSAHLVAANLYPVQSGDGVERAVGSVTIANDGPYAITSFRLTLRVNDVARALTPYDASLTAPLMVRSIPANSTIEIPVATGEYRTDPDMEIASVSMTASLDGPPGAVTDSIAVP